MTLAVAGHCSCRAAIVVTASGGGCQAPCAIATRICWNLRKPRPTTSTAIAKSTKIIRLFTSGSSLSPCSVNVDAAILDQRPGGARHLGASHPVVRQSRNLIEACPGEIVLPGQNQEVRGEPRRVPVPLRLELDLGRLAPGAGRLDSLARGLERGRGVEHFRADRLSNARQIGLGLPLEATRHLGVRPRRAVSDREA